MDSQIGNDVIGTIKSQSLIEIPYGWLECNGQAISRTKYSVLFNKFNNQLYDDDPTHTLLSRYGVGDGSTTFNLPDYREVVLVGIGSNGTDIINNTTQSHDEYTLGEFKDDQIQNITGSVKIRRSVSSFVASVIFDAKDIVSITENTTSNTYLGQAASSGYSDQLNIDTSRVARTGTTTHSKQKGIVYIIKVL